MGFSEVQHTADWALNVWGSSIAELFSEAARGTYHLMSVEKLEMACKPFTFKSTKGDKEIQLVSFLQELIYLLEEKKAVYERFEFHFSPGSCRAMLYGRKCKSMVKMIKAVTFHNLLINQEETGFRVEIVFDV